jgi:acetyl-CoA acetyltransferase
MITFRAMGMHMGNIAEKIIAEMGIRREALDEWTKTSYMRARSAQSNKFFEWEIVDIVKEGRKEQQRISMDEE